MGNIGHLTRVSLSGLALAAATLLPTPLMPTVAHAAGVRLTIDVCAWEDMDWEDMKPAQRNAWAVLGWNERRWDKSIEPVSDSKDWDELSKGERGALTDLGYRESTWDDGDC